MRAETAKGAGKLVLVPAVGFPAPDATEQDQDASMSRVRPEPGIGEPDPDPVAGASSRMMMPFDAVDAPQSEVEQACERLRRLQRTRIFCIKRQSQCDRSIEALIANDLGYRTDFDKLTGKKLWAAAKEFRITMEKAPDLSGLAYYGKDAVEKGALVWKSRDQRAEWDRVRAATEKEMAALVRGLPVWEWVKTVKGAAEISLATIIGEAGDLGNYSNPAKLWKRLGLAVMDGKRQGNPGSNASAAEWTRHGYKPQRRGQIAGSVTQPLFFAQHRKTGDGPYGVIYSDRKLVTLERGWTPGHADSDARRIMTKAFLRDLWEAWRRAAGSELDTTQGMSPADYLDAAE